MHQWTANRSRWAGVIAIALAAASLGAAPPAAWSQTADASITAKEGPSVNCIQTQSTSCDHSTQANAAASIQPDPAIPPQPTALLSLEQDAAISDLLLGLCYFGLPIGLGLAIWLFDQHRNQKLSQLQAQIDLLERIWRQTPQH